MNKVISQRSVLNSKLVNVLLGVSLILVLLCCLSEIAYAEMDFLPWDSKFKRLMYTLPSRYALVVAAIGLIAFGFFAAFGNEFGVVWKISLILIGVVCSFITLIGIFLSFTGSGCMI